MEALGFERIVTDPILLPLDFKQVESHKDLFAKRCRSLLVATGEFHGPWSSYW